VGDTSFDELLQRDLHFLNLFDPTYMDIVADYNVESPIIIKDLKSDYIIFENNHFEGNIGMFGGAVHIHFTNDSHVPVVFKNNTYTKNMAYFSGNSVYVKGVCQMFA
jgi:hypothetical protein